MNTRYDRTSFSCAVAESVSYSEVARKLNLTTRGGHSFIAIKKYIRLYGLDISHFVSVAINHQINGVRPGIKMELSKILVEDSTYSSTNNLKKRLYTEGIKQRKCEICGQGEIWHGHRLSLILDHINGNRTDNRLENLRIVCPNCDATLPTKSRGKLGFNTSHKYDRRADNPIKRSVRRRKVDRPAMSILLEDINSLGYRGTGGKYGVSDNAIRKWVLFYRNFGDLV